MNENDDILFDRLADGELGERDRRELLGTLDDRPGGWRKCALAFLEAQTWRREMGSLVNEPVKQTNTLHGDDIRNAGDSQIASRRAVQFLTLAASVFIAFTLGLAFGDLPHPHQTATPSPFNSQAASTPSVKTAPMPPTNGAQLAGPGQPGTGDAITFWARDETGRVRPLRVPLVDANTMDRRFGTAFQSGVPQSLRDQLEQRGYQVESQRRYAPLVLDNGRPLIVPVEDTKIVPVSNRVY